MGNENDPHYGEESGQQPHMGETDEPQGAGEKPMSTGGGGEETDGDTDNTEKSGMTENM